MHSTKTVLALLAAAGLGLSALAFAQPEKSQPAKPAEKAEQPANKPDAKPEPKTPAQPAVTPVAPPVPEPAKPRPVPTGEAVQKSEIEGILIEDLKIGTGYEVKPAGAVVAYYHGTLKEGGNGKAFDSAFERGEPMAFPLTRVVEGWQKGVPGMKVGGVRRLTIPSKFGYGPQGSGDRIPPNADLVFVIELVDALQFTDVKPGTGDEITGMCIAAFAQGVKDKDGKEIEKADPSHPAIWIPGDTFSPAFQLDWFQDALVGMKVGGKRKIHLPKEMNTPQPGGLEVKHPINVAIDLDLELLSVRSVQRKGR